jgi:hypothetical protein
MYATRITVFISIIHLGFKLPMTKYVFGLVVDRIEFDRIEFDIIDFDRSELNLN